MRQERVLNLIKDFLTRQEGVIFAYAYGSLVRGEPFRDVNIAIYVKSPQENPVVISKETMDAAGVKSKMIKDNRMIIPEDRIEKAILFIRGQKVMLDAKLAWLYGVSVERLNEAVRRNINRFPADFMFQLTKKEFEELKNQIGWVNLKSQGEKTFFWAYLFENQYVDQLRPGSRIMVKEEVKITGGLKHPNITLSLTKGENHDIFSFKEGEI